MSVAPSNQEPLPVACRGATIREKRQLLDRKEKQRRRAYLASLLFSFLSLLSGGEAKGRHCLRRHLREKCQNNPDKHHSGPRKEERRPFHFPLPSWLFFLLFACKITVSDCGGNGEGFPLKKQGSIFKAVSPSPNTKLNVWRILLFCFSCCFNFPFYHAIPLPPTLI